MKYLSFCSFFDVIFLGIVIKKKKKYYTINKNDLIFYFFRKKKIFFFFKFSYIFFFFENFFFKKELYKNIFFFYSYYFNINILNYKLANFYFFFNFYKDNLNCISLIKNFGFFLNNRYLPKNNFTQEIDKFVFTYYILIFNYDFFFIDYLKKENKILICLNIFYFFEKRNSFFIFFS